MRSKSLFSRVVVLVAVVGLMVLLTGTAFAQTPRPHASDVCDYGGRDGSILHPCRPGSPTPTPTDTGPYPSGAVAPAGLGGNAVFVSNQSAAADSTNILLAMAVLGGMVVLCVTLISRTRKDPS